MEGTWDVTWKLSDSTRITSSLTMKSVADGQVLREEGVQADGSKTVEPDLQGGNPTSRRLFTLDMEGMGSIGLEPIPKHECSA